MMGLADVTVYAALLSRIGLVPLAVTTSLNINFLRKPAAHTPIWARATMLKVRRTHGGGRGVRVFGRRRGACCSLNDDLLYSAKKT